MSYNERPLRDDRALGSGRDQDGSRDRQDADARRGLRLEAFDARAAHLAQLGSAAHPRHRPALHDVQRPALGLRDHLGRRLACRRPRGGSGVPPRVAVGPALRRHSLRAEHDSGYRAGRNRTECAEHQRGRGHGVVCERVVAAFGRRRRCDRIPALRRRHAVRRPRYESGDGRESSVRRSGDDRCRRGRRCRQRVGSVDRDGGTRPVRGRECACSATAAAGRHDTAFDARRRVRLRCQPDGCDAVVGPVHRRRRRGRLPPVQGRRGCRHRHGHALHLHGSLLRDDLCARAGRVRCCGQLLRHLLGERRNAGVRGRLDTAFDTRGSGNQRRRPDLGDPFVERVERRHRRDRVFNVPGRLADRQLRNDELHLHRADLRDDLHPRRRSGRCRQQRLRHSHEERHDGCLPGHHTTLDAHGPRPECGGSDVRCAFVERVDRRHRSDRLPRIP